MERIAEFEAIVRGTRNTPLAGSHEVDALLRSVLVHVAYADGIVVEAEFDRLAGLFPGQSAGEVFAWVTEEAARPMDFDALLAAFPDDASRRGLVRLAHAMAMADGEEDEVEDAFVAALEAMIGV